MTARAGEDDSSIKHVRRKERSRYLARQNGYNTKPNKNKKKQKTENEADREKRSQIIQFQIRNKINKATIYTTYA